eukprot:scaffold754_cov248-Pinguiococcus_pyrenoidosus.AAC.5
MDSPCSLSTPSRAHRWAFSASGTMDPRDMAPKDSFAGEAVAKSSESSWMGRLRSHFRREDEGVARRLALLRGVLPVSDATASSNS